MAGDLAFTYYGKGGTEDDKPETDMLTPAQQARIEKKRQQTSIISFQGKMTPNVRYPACARRGQTAPEDAGYCAIRTCVRPVCGAFDYTGRISSYFCGGHGGGR